MSIQKQLRALEQELATVIRQAGRQHCQWNLVYAAQRLAALEGEFLARAAIALIRQQPKRQGLACFAAHNVTVAQRMFAA